MLAVSFVIGIAIVTVVSCSKTDQEKVNHQGVITHFSPSKDMVVPTITKFIQRFENYKAGYKTGGEDIKLGEAIWTLEAGVNFEFQSPKEELADFVTDSTTFNVDVYIGENNEYYITEENAVNLYDEMLSFTGEQVAPEDIDLFVTDLQVTSVENGQAEMKVTAVKGPVSPIPCTVQSDDYWYAAGDAGMCDTYQGQNIGKDAAWRINHILNCISLDVGYWTDISNTGIVVSYYDENYDPCFWGMDYSGSFDDCLSPTNIQYWIGQADYVIEDLKPANKELVNCRFRDDLLTSDGTWFHYFINIRYGIPHEEIPD